MARGSGLLAACLAGLPTLASAAAPPAFKPVRSDESYAHLARSPDPAPGDRFRYIPLGAADDVYLTLGGEARLRVDATDAPRFGLGGGPGDVFGLGRALLSADLHLGPRLRVYGELGLHRDLGKKAAPAVSDRDALDAQVAFVDLTPNPSLRLRAGRQELMFNPTQRFIAVREGPNIRQSFDGLRVTRQTASLKLDAFYLRPVVIKTGPFDDRTNTEQRFFGLYASRSLSPAAALDLYLLELNRDGVRFGSVSGDERRKSIGLRLAGNRGAFDYEAEGMAQGGRFAGRKIRAWGGSLGGGYTLDRAWRPRLGLRLDAGSGDKDPSDRKLESFNPLFPKGAYFNETGLTSWTNLVALRPSLGVNPTKAVSLEASYLFRSRQTGQDAVYLQPYVALAPIGSDRSVGGAVQLDAGWQASRNLKLQAQIVHQSVDGAVKRLGGHGGDFGMLIAQWRF